MKRDWIARRLWVWPLAALLLVAAVFAGLAVGEPATAVAQPPGCASLESVASAPAAPTAVAFPPLPPAP